MNGRDDADERPTQANVPGRSSWGLNVNTPDSDEEKTTVLSPELTRRRAQNEQQTLPVDDTDEDVDEARTRILQAPRSASPIDLSRVPVAWLAIVDGPGLGRTFPLFYGSNRIGRGTDVEVALNFGDESISRGAHARITYDAKGRRYYVQSGEGTGLTYRDGEPILTPTSLDAHAQIEIGHTTLRFMPLCSIAFDWQDLPVVKGQTK